MWTGEEASLEWTGEVHPEGWDKERRCSFVFQSMLCW